MTTRRAVVFAPATMAAASLFAAAGPARPDTRPNDLLYQYTSLSDKVCTTISRDQEIDSISFRCPGIGGYGLELSEGDLRQNLVVITPSRQRHDLNLASTLRHHGFSNVGKTAEWWTKTVRGRKVLVAIIFRYEAAENPDNGTIRRSYLVVASIRANASCTIAKIDPGPKQNQLARALVAGATGAQCVPPE